MKLTWDDFYEICQAEKPNRLKPPDWEKVEIAVATKLAVQRNHILHSKIVDLKSKYSKYIDSRRKRKSNDRDTLCSDVVFDSDDYDSLTPESLLRNVSRKFTVYFYLREKLSLIF